MRFIFIKIKIDLINRVEGVNFQKAELVFFEDFFNYVLNNFQYLVRQKEIGIAITKEFWLIHHQNFGKWDRFWLK